MVKQEAYMLPSDPKDRHPIGNGVASDAPQLSALDYSVKGRNFLITGATMGLGHGITESLIRAGAAKVMITGRRADIGADAAQRLQRMSKETAIMFERADSASPEDCEKLAKAATEKLGEIHGLVNCAASTERNDMFSTTVDFWDQLMASNVRGPFMMTQAVSRHMREKNIHGSIVNISSIASYGGTPKTSTYSISKAALNGMTKIHAYELMRHRIRVNAVCMGQCLTDYEEVHGTIEHGSDWLTQADKACPLGRILRGQDVTATVGFLLSDASVMMTGQLIAQHPEKIFTCWG